MTQLFTVVLSLSVSGALVGLLVLLFRPICGRIFSKRWAYYLWLLVIARMLLPIHADVNLMEYLSENLAAVGSHLTNAAETEDDNGRTGTAADVTRMEDIAGQNNASGVADADTTGNREVVGISSVSDAQKISVGSMNSSAKIDIKASFLQAAAIIWIWGVILTALRKLLIYRRFVREVGTACASVTNERILVQSAEIQRRLRIGKRVPLYESTSIESPMLIGFWTTRIYLPQALLTEMTGREDDICLMLHHELVHYRRKDIWYKWLFQAALCVHWFNPLVYVFRRKFNVDCELACDETVLKLLSEEGRRAYGNMLLDVAQKDWSEGMFSGKSLGKRIDVPAMTLLEEKSTLKERLRGIARYHKTGLIVGLCSAAVLVLFVIAAVVCGVKGTYGGSGKSLLLHNSGNLVSSFAEHFWENSTWSEMWKDSFDLAQPIVVSSSGTAYRMYDDDALIAGDSENDCWRAWKYIGGDGGVDVQKFLFNGSDTLWILYANKETTLEISSVFSLYDGRFKFVWVGPDHTVQTLNESGEESTVKLTLPQGRNVIKMVGQKAKVKDLSIAYGRMKKEDFDGIYDNEATEYAYQVLAGKQPFDAAKLEEVGPYLKEKEVSELCRKALEEEVVLSKENWQKFFIYSDEKLTARYLLEALQTDGVREFDSEILVAIMPYMQAVDVSECFRYLLERDAAAVLDWQEIFVYSDADKSAGYLAEALREGKANDFSDRALQKICPYVSTKSLTDVVAAMDELSFVGLDHVLAYVQEDDVVTCVYHYIDLGNVLTDEELRKVQAYVSERDFYRIVEYNGKKK